MLTALSIRDVVLIERLDLHFGAGLTTLTGETGAGKSILLDSLGLALGARADAGLIRAGAEQAVVAAVFSVPPEPSGGGAAGGARAGWRRGDCAAPDRRRGMAAPARWSTTSRLSVALLKRLGALLIEVQGQHEQVGLADPANHLALLDAFGVPGEARGAGGGSASRPGGTPPRG